ncbi:MAG: HDOD domain-containing protein [Nitrospiraceae bacterium]|nr:MAG: HDOD domain-containing protein [Nitrospiraceae bacterium]
MADILKSYIRKIKEIPTLPTVAREVLKMTNDPYLSIDDLIDVLGTDPAISSKILSVSNSAFFGYPVRTTKLNDAIMRVGFNNVKSIAVGISVLSFLGPGKKTIEYNRLYNHSVFVGLTSRYMAETLGLDIAEDILVDGLLHDLGQLALLRYFPDLYREIMAAFNKTKSILMAEKQALSYTHADIGFWLADQWGLPETILDTTLYHHTPSLAKRNAKYSAIVHVADFIAVKNNFSPVQEDPSYPLDLGAFDILSITDNDLREMEESIARVPFSDEIFTLPKC